MRPLLPRAGSRRDLLLSKPLAFSSGDQTNQSDKAATRYPWEWMHRESNSRHWDPFDFWLELGSPIWTRRGSGLGWECTGTAPWDLGHAGCSSPQESPSGGQQCHSSSPHPCVTQRVPIRARLQAATSVPSLTCVARLAGALVAIDLVDALAVVAGVAGAVVQVDLAVGP